MLEYIYETVLNNYRYVFDLDNYRYVFKFTVELILTYYILQFINRFRNRQNKKIMLSIEGNIGTGKSSLMAYLKDNLGIEADYISEPVDEWLTIKDEDGKDILQTFYDDKKRWAYTFQNIAYITRMNHIIGAIMNSRNKYIILDRSLQADLNTFAKMLYESHDLNMLEMNVYGRWNNFFERFYGDLVEHKIVYLRCDPTVSLERIKMRNRSAEKTVPLEYLEKLHYYHDKWLNDNNKENVLIIDVNSDFVNNLDRADQIKKQIKSFIIV